MSSTCTQENWIKAVLCNDETSTDEELINYFIEEGELTREDSEELVAKRSSYLRGDI